ncbi:MAG TPA: ankyrin repeat domain-containing protein [Patescibacteria group bacterium]|nr:ankyrin repeat domain-containing protein [Patescibacteria group bacterium]
MSVVDIDDEDDDKWLDYVSALTPLARAELFVKSARDGELWRCERLIEKGVDPHFRDGQALILAAEKGRRGVIGLLLSHVPSQVIKDNALVNAVVGGSVDAVKALLAAGADPRHDDSAPLWYCATKGRAAIAELLLDAGADVHAHGRELMGVALAHRDVETATVFLRHGASPSAYYRDLNAFEWSAEMGLMEFSKVLRQWVEGDAYIGPAFFRTKTLEELRAPMPERHGRTGFHLAAAAGSFDVVTEKIRATPGAQLRLDDLLRQTTPEGPSVLALLGQVGQLKIAFEADLWAGRKDEMLQAYAKTPAGFRGQLDLAATVSAVDRLSIRPKPGQFRLKP